MVKKPVKKKVVKNVVRRKVVHKKPKPPPPDTTRADIHAILNECDGEEALRRIRELLYGPAPETPGEAK